MKVFLPTRSAFRKWLPARRRDSHKGDFGHALIVAGSRGMRGAGRLAVLGALRSGAGWVTWAAPEGERGAGARGPWEAMTLPLPESKGAVAARAVRTVLSYARDRRVTALGLGPGLSVTKETTRFVLDAIAKAPLPLVIDADALNALASRGPVPHRAPWVMTPHAGEAARLLKTSTAAVQRDRSGAAGGLAGKFGAVVVLKGAGTLVTDGRVLFKNASGNPGMASGGMGDVLTGMIAALIGQVKASSPEEACFRAAVLGVRLHGRAGDRAAEELGPAGLLATDLALRIPAARKDL